MRALSFLSFASFRWVVVGTVLSLAASAALADSKKATKSVVVKSKKSLAACTSFDQVDKDDDKVALTIHNTCTVPIDCVITWRLVCSPESKTRRAEHLGSAKLSLTEATSLSHDASASTCGDASWQLDQVRWNCQPNKE